MMQPLLSQSVLDTLDAVRETKQGALQLQNNSIEQLSPSSHQLSEKNVSCRSLSCRVSSILIIHPVRSLFSQKNFREKNMPRMGETDTYLYILP